MWTGAKVPSIAKLGELEGLPCLAWLPVVSVKNMLMFVYEGLSFQVGEPRCHPQRFFLSLSGFRILSIVSEYHTGHIN